MATIAPTSAVTPRRILATRNAGWAKSLAHRLARSGVRPNSVSIAGVLFAAAACSAFLSVPVVSAAIRPWALLLAAAAIQLRLLCNLLDGMLAVEEGFKSKTGELYNDLPDRVADVLILVGAGCSIPDLRGGPTLGWAAAVTAVLTAYVRVLGASFGGPQHFIGPMAKQHRMFALTIATFVAFVEAMLGMSLQALRAGLWWIVIGSIVTACRRTHRIAGEMEAR